MGGSLVLLCKRVLVRKKASSLEGGNGQAGQKSACPVFFMESHLVSDIVCSELAGVEVLRSGACRGWKPRVHNPVPGIQSMPVACACPDMVP